MTKVLFQNGKIFQWDSDSSADWMEIDAQSGKIVDIGKGSVKENDNYDRVIDLSGKTVLPGLIDSHIHAYMLGECFYFLDLNHVKSIENLKAALKKYDVDNQDSKWIVGYGWNQNLMGRMVTRDDIDEVVKNRPVFLWRVCYHVGVANTKALEIAHVPLSTSDLDCENENLKKNSSSSSSSKPCEKFLALGRDFIEYDDTKNGQATGLLKEQAAIYLSEHIKETNVDIRKKYFRKGLDLCTQSGLTTIQSNDEKAKDIYNEIFKEKEAMNDRSCRVFLSIPFLELENHDGPLDCENDNVENKLFSNKRVKIFSDGSLGASTAAMKRSYNGTENKGLLFHSEQKMTDAISAVIKKGFKLEIHAIGDAAMEQVLQGYKKNNITQEDRAIITHCQFVDKGIIEQMKDMGVIANIQPSFTVTDYVWSRECIPSESIDYSYCWKTLLKENVHCAGGSDSPIETCNPLIGMYHAIYRRNPDSPYIDDEHNKAQCLSFRESLDLYTRSGAYAVGNDKLGSLEKGFEADFIVLDSDVVNDNSLLLTANVEQVWIKGKQSLKSNPEKEKNTSMVLGLGKNGPRNICPCCIRHK